MKLNTLFLILGLAGSQVANAAMVVDTGTPDNTSSLLSVNSAQYIAGQVSFAQSLTIDRIQVYLQADLGTGAGDTFSISLYSDQGNQVGTLIDGDTTLASFGADGWNGVSNLNWSVGAGTYWVAIEEQQDGINFIVPGQVTQPLLHTAFFDGASYQTTSTPLAFGLTVSAVPEADSYAMLLTGLGLLGVARRRSAIKSF